MNTAIFGVVAGLTLSVAGASITYEPIKTISLIIALVVAHCITKGNT